VLICKFKRDDRIVGEHIHPAIDSNLTVLHEEMRRLLYNKPVHWVHCPTSMPVTSEDVHHPDVEGFG
jgi:hypothetical protein